MKILIIEDDIFFQKFYSEKLRELNFEVDVASDGEEGFNKINSIKPDLLLLDLILPKKDGFEILKELESMQQKPHILVFSTLGQEEDVEKAKLLGANDYVNKSFIDFDFLLSKINNLLKAT